MIEKDGVSSIQDNFLVEEQFVALRDIIDDFDFPWHYNPAVIYGTDNSRTGPGYFSHNAYENNVPCSSLYNSLSHILSRLDVIVLARIRVNLNPRTIEPYFSDFHTDISMKSDRHNDLWMKKHKSTSQWTTSIFYINTNNGYTELEDGTIIESVANRVVSFPLNTNHRFVTQTDEQIRLLINFGYV